MWLSVSAQERQPVLQMHRYTVQVNCWQLLSVFDSKSIWSTSNTETALLNWMREREWENNKLPPHTHSEVEGEEETNRKSKKQWRVNQNETKADA